MYTKKQQGPALSSSKGFTVIELIVVIAVIAILAAIVMSSIVQYSNKGKNAGIKGNLANIIANGTDYFNANSNYTNFCSNTGMTTPEAAANKASGSTTRHICTATAWCVCSPMIVTATEPTNSTFCVDSKGYKKVTQNAGLCTTRCPAAGSCVD